MSFGDRLLEWTLQLLIKLVEEKPKKGPTVTPVTPPAPPVKQ